MSEELFSDVIVKTMTLELRDHIPIGFDLIDVRIRGKTKIDLLLRKEGDKTKINFEK